MGKYYKLKNRKFFAYQIRLATNLSYRDILPYKKINKKLQIVGLRWYFKVFIIPIIKANLFIFIILMNISYFHFIN